MAGFYLKNQGLIGSPGVNRFNNLQTIGIGSATGLYNFTTATFTNGGQTGRLGPSLTQARNGLIGPEVADWRNNTEFFNTTNGIQLWTVPADGTYRIQAIGASGGAYRGLFNNATPGIGLGATIRGDFQLTAGEIIRIVVGQAGDTQNNGNGGGGASWVYKGNIGVGDPLIVAGGGGGHGHGSANNTSGGFGAGGSSTTQANNSGGGTGTRSGAGIGQGGLGGSTPCGAGGTGGGGAGWLSDGQNEACSNTAGSGGTRFNGASSDLNGGFGGGGSANGNGRGGGGGGGYTGGGGGNGWSGSTWGGGGGGGSFNAGTSQINTAGETNHRSNQGTVFHGQVAITRL